MTRVFPRSRLCCERCDRCYGGGVKKGFNVEGRKGGGWRGGGVDEVAIKGHGFIYTDHDDVRIEGILSNMDGLGNKTVASGTGRAGSLLRPLTLT